MQPAPPSIDASRAVEHLLDLLRVEGLSGSEEAVATRVREKLLAAGCRPEWLRHDDLPERVPGAWEVGNLILSLPGTFKGPRRLFAAHLDTVPLCRGARPAVRGGRIVAEGPTALGADDRTAVACLVTVVETVLRHAMPHPPLTFLFSVGEEVGLVGARHVRRGPLGRPVWGINVDSGDPRKVIVAAPGAERWQAEIHGIAAHAGVHPEDGVSAVLIASRAIRDLERRGWFGRIRKREGTGTANVGVLQGGEVTNQVTDRLEVRGECRSHDRDFLSRITATCRSAFEDACRRVRNARGRTGRLRFRRRVDYHPFRLPDDARVVRHALACARRLRWRPHAATVDGGLDANWLNAHGIPTVTIGAGQHGAHTTKEYADTREFLDGCRLALRLATEPEDAR